MSQSGRRGYTVAAVIVLAILPLGVPAETVFAGVLDRISQDKTIRIAYREDAPPFSYKDKIGEPVGFMVDLCRDVAKRLAEQRNFPSLNVTYVPVTAADRFEAIQQQKADILCEPTSATTEEALRNSLKLAEITADVMPAKTHAEGLAMLEEGKVSAYFGDRSILVSLIKDSKAPDKLMLAENYFSVEPYALALPHGDEAFRLAVDRALSHIYRSGEIAAIFKRTFGDQTKPGQVLQTLYLIAGLPD
jgi:ABC-type amino acid transport substrate-binding protein